MKHKVRGELIWEDQRYYYTTEGVFSKKWYRLEEDVA